MHPGTSEVHRGDRTAETATDDVDAVVFVSDRGAGTRNRGQGQTHRRGGGTAQKSPA
jgi:hypothetical protein